MHPISKTTVLLVLLLLVFAAFRRAAHTHRYVFPSPAFFPKMPLPQYPITKEAVELGRHLFYDTILSRDSTLSCASCHKQQFAFSDAGKPFSTGNNGVKQSRNTPGLFNLAWQPSFFWDGRSQSIEGQVLIPVAHTNEMNLTWAEATERVKHSKLYKKLFRAAYGNAIIDSGLITNAIGQFERTILSYRSKYDRVLAGKDTFTSTEAEGFELMNDMTMGDCLHCHITDGSPLGSTFSFSNNGLDIVPTDSGRAKITGLATDIGKFKIPTVRNLSFTAPYMHDGRFNTLEEVLDFYSEGVHPSINVDSKMEFAYQGGAKLTPEQKRKIIEFLHTLNDSTLTTDPAFASPFMH